MDSKRAIYEGSNAFSLITGLTQREKFKLSSC